jgi:hypothetical protein
MVSADAGASHASTATKKKKAKNLQLSFSTGSGLNSRHRGGRGLSQEVKSPWEKTRNKEQRTPKGQSSIFQKSQNTKRQRQLRTFERTNETSET